MFEALSLHDAMLHAISVDLEHGHCSFHLSPVGASVTTELRFLEVADVHIPRKMPWGPSRSVNALRQLGQGEFEVELQSGDVVRVCAKSWSLCQPDGEVTKPVGWVSGSPRNPTFRRGLLGYGEDA